MGNRVFIVGPDGLVEDMFKKREFEIVTDLSLADFVCFTGGADVSPDLYGEKPHPTTYTSRLRDEIDVKVFNAANKLCLPLVGICRGGQFLNVMNGGKMWQNVDRHTQSHYLKDTNTGELIQVTSTHHQMMIPAVRKPGQNNAPVIVATASESTKKETATSIVFCRNNNWEDIEVVYYPNNEALCFQPHPEYGLKSCEEYFFSLLDRFYIGVTV